MQMLKINRISGLFLLITLLACAGCADNSYVALKKADVFPKMYRQKPLTVLVLPVQNQSNNALASEYVSSTLVGAIVDNGYYLIPMEVSNELLNAENMLDNQQMNQVDYPRLKELLDADAVLITKITDWGSTFYVVGSYSTLGVSYNLISTITGDTLWSRTEKRKLDTSTIIYGDPVAIAAGIVVNATKAEESDYLYKAQLLNYSVFSSLPEGYYSPRYLDLNDEFYQFK
jgi:hypothetical protein